MMKKRMLFCFLLSVTGISLIGCGNQANVSQPAESEMQNQGDDSGQTGFSPEGSFETEILSADDALQWAYNHPVVVFEDCSCSSGKAVWNTFFESADAKQPASVLCVHYYTLDEEHVSPELYEEEKDQYPCLFYSLIVYDGTEFRLKARLSTETELDLSETYQYLVHLTGENPETALYKYTDEYDLVDDASVTWEQLQKSMFSSQYSDRIKFYTAYRDFYN